MFKNLLIIAIATAFLASCSPNNVTIVNGYEKYFTQNNVKGSFAIYNNGQSNFIIYNLNRYKDSSYSPAATFNILSSMIGLQNGIIPNESKVVAQDSAEKSTQQIFAGLSLADAFKTNSIPYFQSLSRNIGAKDLQYWIDSIKYGNKKMNTIDSFWFNNSLKITSDEALGFVEKVYFNQLPFQKRAQNIVKKLMVKESNANYQLAYQMGTTMDEKNHQIGWIAGWVEENKHPYFFVVNTESDKQYNMDTIKSTLLKPILKELGFFEGKK